MSETIDMEVLSRCKICCYAWHSMSRSFVADMMQRVVPMVGARVELEPAWGYAGRVVFSDGRVMHFLGYHLDANPLGAAAIATDKTYALHFLARAGLPIVEGEAFFSCQWARAIGSDRTPEAALRYAEQMGFPCIVKPNGLGCGKGVQLTGDREAFMRATRSVTRLDRVFRVERPVQRGAAGAWTDLRIVVVGDVVACAYERIPLAVVGDGRTTIAALLQQHLLRLRVRQRHVYLRASDARIANRLARERRTLADVPVTGERVVLLDNANLSCGGAARDSTDYLDPALAALAIRATRALGLAFAGVDVMVAPVSPPLQEGVRAVILEVNAAPSLAHFAAIGSAERARAEECYRRVLEGFARHATMEVPYGIKRIPYPIRAIR